MNEEIKDELDLEDEDTEFDLEEEGITPPPEEDNEGSEDDEFEYDDEGNIVIPDETEDETTDETEGTEVDTGKDDRDETPEDDAQADAATEPAAEDKGADTSASDDKDAEIARLRAQNAEKDAVIRDALIALGADGNEGIDGLLRLAAEAEDIPLDQYRAKRAEKARTEEAVREMQRREFEKKTLADLKAVQEAYPETKAYKTVFDLPNFAKFAKFRDAGLTPEEAYIAANGKQVMSSVASATKQQALNRTKDHIRSNVPKKAKDTSLTISKKTLAEYREIFPNMSDKEIIALYKQTMKK